MSEYTLQQLFTEYLKSIGFDVHQEVPFLSRSIDVVAIKGNEICAYELKLHNWRKAITQSIDHLHGVDRSYICMPLKSHISEELICQAQLNGLGLVMYDEENRTLNEILPAPDSEFVWEPARKWLTSAMELTV
ncbi:MAG TPA: hypothetical protein VLA88_02460 [Candidatus Saccharimonadales bacterium]|nr:hypothetical protein [Candidatus Saccharimonadales bacterium]